MNRAYSLGILAGVGAGFASASGLMLILYASNYRWQASEGILTWFGLFTTALGIVFLLAPWLFAEPAEYAPPAEPAPPAPETRAASYETVQISGIRPGVYHHYRPSSTIEAAWIDGIANFCLWARQLQSLASSKHVGVSVQNPNDWQLVIAPLVEHGAILPTQKGVETRWAPEWDASRAYDAVRAGWVAMPETRPPHVAPYSAARMTVDNAVPSRS